MSLLDNLPHLCTIVRKAPNAGLMGSHRNQGKKEQTNVACWEQTAGDSSLDEFDKPNISRMRKVYFNADPNVSERHLIIITHHNGVAVEGNQLEVVSSAAPDSSVGMGLLWKVSCEYISGKDD